MSFTERTIRPVQLDHPWRDAVVSVSGYFYAVDLCDGAHPQRHRVGKDRKCTCGRGADCPAVQAVVEYLKSGGERTPDPPPGYFPVAPLNCPVCGAEAYFAPSLSSKRRGAGWACARGGTTHYWQHQGSVLRGLFASHPWLFPPVLAPDGRVLYAGVRRDEVITEDTVSRE